MPPKKPKTKKKSKEEKEPIDEYTEMSGADLERQLASYKEKLVDAKMTRNMLQMEKDMIHDFYSNTREEIAGLNAQIKNLDTDMQTKEEGQRTQLNVFMQKVRHIEFQHGLDVENVQNQGQQYLAQEEDYRKKQEKEIKQDIKNAKSGVYTNIAEHHQEIEITEKETK